MTKEDHPRQTHSIGRRDVVWGVGGAAVAAAVAVGLDSGRKARTPDDASKLQQVLFDLEQTRRKLNEALLKEAGRRQAQVILRAPAWTELDLNAFLEGLSREGLASMRKALSMGESESNAQLETQSGKVQVAGIKKKILWCSSNVVEYPFRNENNIQYHQLVKWVADEVGVHEEITNSQSTFVIEHALCKKLFVDIWDRLSEKQRLELLSKVDVPGKASDHAAIATLSGSAAISALSFTVYFSGFAFYTTMSIMISSVAGWIGLTLPMATYTGASSMIAFLSGPIGWAIAATAALVGVALAGRANVRETTAAVVQIHMLKVAALEGLQSVPDDIFSVVGRVFPRKPSAA